MLFQLIAINIYFIELAQSLLFNIDIVFKIILILENESNTH